MSIIEDILPRLFGCVTLGIAVAITAYSYDVQSFWTRCNDSHLFGTVRMKDV
jgi:hypothetical protein